MFSGIVEEIGEILAVSADSEGERLRIKAGAILADACLGESISVSGVCLTVVEFSDSWFDVEATMETLRCTTLGGLKTGDRVNLEKALKVARLGGHIVSGHVDAVGRVLEVEKQGFSRVIKFAFPARWSPYFVEKGSVTVNGVSLTVVDIGTVRENSSGAGLGDEHWFSVALIPHTMEVTTLGALSAGDPVNIETDIIARYVVRLISEGYVENLNKARGSVLSSPNDS